jgi:mannose-1-phosphate guanylyltransferase
MEWVRPWGSYQILGENPVCVKIITVNPNSRLSLQTHEHRSEIWFALKSGLIATVGNKQTPMQPLERILVQKSEQHRIANPTNEPIQLVELMFGIYDENDIFRLEDDYKR